ncbi:hypothetical protein [Thorsellia anophelis]|uniref:Sel1 repeat-containing protein n=1 Tax=Thorsellia anophelis DSM 18579 TaxID=1123402 RepID=A0A1H9ZPB2_9GAMM|nr:hypothetical protein [Thorsellia anophelis]SES83511.1 hypothetical protein SAMN02583745_00634 [Thorsellia anophelis DSM 18579]
MNRAIFSKIFAVLLVIFGIFKFIGIFKDINSVSSGSNNSYQSTHTASEFLQLNKHMEQYYQFCEEQGSCNDSVYNLYNMTQKANLGDKSALNDVALVYAFGYNFNGQDEGVKPSFAKAVIFSKLLSEAGDARGLYYLGMIYRIGDKSIQQDFEQSTSYFIQYIDETNSDNEEYATYRAKALMMILQSYFNKKAPNNINENNITRYKNMFFDEYSIIASQGEPSEIGRFSAIYFQLANTLQEKQIAYAWSIIALEQLESSSLQAEEKLKIKALLQKNQASMASELTHQEIAQAQLVAKEWSLGKSITKMQFMH